MQNFKFIGSKTTLSKKVCISTTLSQKKVIIKSESGWHLGIMYLYLLYINIILSLLK